MALWLKSKHELEIVNK